MSLSAENLNCFYNQLWKTGENSDSPDGSRTDLIRIITRHIALGHINYALGLGSGPQAVEVQLYAIRKIRDQLQKIIFHTLDIADIPRRNLLATRRGKIRVSHSQGDALALPSASDGYDLVYSNMAIDFIPRTERYLPYTEAYRVLRAGGVFAATFHHPDTIRLGLPNAKLKSVREHWSYLLENNILFETEGEIGKAFATVGFQATRVGSGQDRFNKWWIVEAEKP